MVCFIIKYDQIRNLFTIVQHSSFQKISIQYIQTISCRYSWLCRQNRIDNIFWIFIWIIINNFFYFYSRKSMSIGNQELTIPDNLPPYLFFGYCIVLYKTKDKIFVLSWDKEFREFIIIRSLKSSLSVHIILTKY